MNTSATRLVGITTIQNALFFQKALPAGARFRRLTNELIPSASPDSCRVLQSLTKSAAKRLRNVVPVSRRWMKGTDVRRGCVRWCRIAMNAFAMCSIAARAGCSTSALRSARDHAGELEAGVGIEPAYTDLQAAPVAIQQRRTPIYSEISAAKDCRLPGQAARRLRSSRGAKP